MRPIWRRARLRFSAPESGYDFASFLLGANNNSQTPEGDRSLSRAPIGLALYIHDDWKVSPKLTINLGLRFDYNGVPVDAQGLWRTLDFVGEGADVGRGEGYRAPDGATHTDGRFLPSVGETGAVKLFKQDVKFFMPRVGIAYRPREKWVFRIGGGWFDNINHMNTWTILNLMPPKSGSLHLHVRDRRLAQRSRVGADGITYHGAHSPVSSRPADFELE